MEVSVAERRAAEKLNALHKNGRGAPPIATGAHALFKRDGTKVIDAEDYQRAIFYEIASQAEAEAGTDNSKGMTPLRVAEAIEAQAGTGGVTTEQLDAAVSVETERATEAEGALASSISGIQDGLGTMAGETATDYVLASTFTTALGNYTPTSGLAASATTDTTNADNITGGSQTGTGAMVRAASPSFTGNLSLETLLVPGHADGDPHTPQQRLLSFYTSGGVDLAYDTYIVLPDNLSGYYGLVDEQATQTLTNKTLTSPTLTTPALGVATATSINGNTITTGTGTLTLSTFTLTVAGTASISGTNTGDQTSVSGNAGTATALATGRTIASTGDVSWTSGSFDGSANVTGTATVVSASDTVPGKIEIATQAEVDAETDTVRAIPPAYLRMKWTATNRLSIGDTGGNTRGNESITIQTSRASATQVASGIAAIAIGQNSRAAAIDSIAAGNTSLTTGSYGISIGSSASTTSTASIALGKSAAASTGSNVVAIGTSSVANANSAISIGYFAGTDNSSVSGVGTRSISIGERSRAYGTNGIAIGYNTLSDGGIVIGGSGQSVSIGATVSGVDSIGISGTTGFDNSTAIGVGSDAEAAASTVIGYYAYNEGENGVAIGYYAQTFGLNSITIGTSSSAAGDNSVAIGGFTGGDNSVAIGGFTGGALSVTIGPGVYANVDGVVEIGAPDVPYARRGAIRIHSTLQAALTFPTSDAPETATAATIGEEADGELAPSMWCSRVSADGNTAFLEYNVAGTIKTASLSLADSSTVDLTAQGAAITATTILTPSVSGMYRVSVILRVSQASDISSNLSGATGVVITYTEPVDSVAMSLSVPIFSELGGAIVGGNAGNSTTTLCQGSVVLHAKTGVAIQYAIGYQSTHTIFPMQFSVHMKIEPIV